jgi:hypothetical protein
MLAIFKTLPSIIIRTVAKIKLEGDVLSLDTLTRMVDDEIAKIKVCFQAFIYTALSLTPAQSAYPQLALNRDSGTSGRLSNVLTAAIGGSITVLGIAKDASAVIPVPGVQAAIGGVVNLLNVVAVCPSKYPPLSIIHGTIPSKRAQITTR